MDTSAQNPVPVARRQVAAAPVVVKAPSPAPLIPVMRRADRMRPYLVGMEGNTHILIRLGDLVMRGAVENGLPTCLREGTARVIRKVEHPSRAIAYVIGDDTVEILVRPCA